MEEEREYGFILVRPRIVRHDTNSKGGAVKGKNSLPGEIAVSHRRAAPQTGPRTTQSKFTIVFSAASRFSAANFTASATSGKRNRCVMSGSVLILPAAIRFTAAW